MEVTKKVSQVDIRITLSQREAECLLAILNSSQHIGEDSYEAEDVTRDEAEDVSYALWGVLNETLGS